MEASGEDPAEVGPPRALRSAREAGVRVALGADTEGPARNPWLDLMLAVTHPARPDETWSLLTLVGGEIVHREGEIVERVR